MISFQNLSPPMASPHHIRTKLHPPFHGLEDLVPDYLFNFTPTPLCHTVPLLDRLHPRFCLPCKHILSTAPGMFFLEEQGWLFCCCSGCSCSTILHFLFYLLLYFLIDPVSPPETLRAWSVLFLSNA